MKYKYKKHIATGALALSLLVGGSSVFAASPQDLGIKNVQSTYQKQGNTKNKKTISKGRSNIVGTISVISGTGFTVEIKNMKTKAVSLMYLKTDASTAYSKNGVSAVASDLTVGQKVVVVGNLDKTTNIVTAKTVKIVINNLAANRIKKNNTKTN